MELKIKGISTNVLRSKKLKKYILNINRTIENTFILSDYLKTDSYRTKDSPLNYRII